MIKRTLFDDDRMYSKKEIGETIDVSPRTVDRMIGDGRLPASFKIGPRCTRLAGRQLNESLAAAVK